MSQGESAPANPVISYIIPAHNPGAQILACVQSILQQVEQPSFEILLIDNNSSDASLERISHPNLRILREAKAGPSAARNLGLAVAKGRYLVFLDADVVLNNNWVFECLGRMAEMPFLDCVQSPIHPAANGRLKMLGLRQAFIGHKTKGSFNYLNCAKATLPVLNSAAFMVKSAYLRSRKIRFNEDLLRCEDLDFTYQLFFSGASFASVPTTKACVYDTRTRWQYIKRSYLNGYYTHRVRALWGGQRNIAAWPARKLSLAQYSLNQSIFIAINFIASAIGESVALLRAPKAPHDQLPVYLQPDHRKQFMLQAEIGAVAASLRLDPFVRLVVLDDSVVLFRLFATDAIARIIFEKDEAAVALRLFLGHQHPYAADAVIPERFVFKLQKGQFLSAN